MQRSRHFELIRHVGPDVEFEDVTVTFDAGAVTGRKLWGVASNLHLRGSFVFRSTNRNGPKQLLQLFDCSFQGDGEFVLCANSTDQASVPVVIIAFANPTKMRRSPKDASPTFPLLRRKSVRPPKTIQGLSRIDQIPLKMENAMGESKRPI